MITGVIDTGGGMRGIYAAGVLDGCMDRKIHFDIAIGISAGCANLASYMAGQKKRNYLFYTEYALRKEYMSFRNVIRKGSFIDMDYVYGTLSNSGGENPLNYRALIENPAAFIVVATDAKTGEAVYFNKNDIPMDDYAVFKASSSIPFVCKPYPVQNTLYYDGALGDPVPVEKAFSMGCDKVVLILTKPKNVPREPGKDVKLAAAIQRKYPLAAEKLRLRAQHYNEGVALAKEYEKQGRLLIVAPEDLCGMDTLSRDVAPMNRMYQRGIKDSQLIQDFLSQ